MISRVLPAVALFLSLCSVCTSTASMSVGDTFCCGLDWWRSEGREAAEKAVAGQPGANQSDARQGRQTHLKQLLRGGLIAHIGRSILRTINFWHFPAFKARRSFQKKNKKKNDPKSPIILSTVYGGLGGCIDEEPFVGRTPMMTPGTVCFMIIASHGGMLRARL